MNQRRLYSEAQWKVAEKMKAINYFRKYFAEEIVSGEKTIDEILDEQLRTPERLRVFNSKDEINKFVESYKAYKLNWKYRTF